MKEVADNKNRLENQVFIRSLSYDVTDEDLIQFFEPCGPIKSATVAREKDSNESRGFGFVTFALSSDALNAVKSLQGKSLKGRPCKLELAVKGGHSASDKPYINDRPEHKESLRKAESTVVNTIEPLGLKESKIPKKEEENITEISENIVEDENTSSMRIAHPTGVRPGLVLLLLGVPTHVKKKELLVVVKRVCRKTGVDLVKDGHYLLESLSLVHPAGKVFVLTAPSRPACTKLIAAFNGASPIGLGLGQDKSSAADKDVGLEIEAPNSPKPLWKDKLYVRTLAQLTQPKFRKRHCRIIVRNLSFQATEANIASKLGKYGPLSEVVMPMTEVTSEGAESTRRHGKTGPHLRPKGFAFVTFLCSSDAENAVKGSSSENGSVLKICNREVAVDFCQSKDRFLESNTKNENVSEKVLDPIEIEQTQNDNAEESGASSADDAHQSDDLSSQDDVSDEKSEEDKLVGNDVIEPLKKDSNAYTNDVEEGRTVFLRGLSLDAEVKDIRRALHPFGKIEVALIVKDRKTGTSRGTAFAKFSNAEEAQACVQASKTDSGLVIADHPCVVDLAVARDEAERLKVDNRSKVDRRHLYLANEGLALGKAEDIATMPEEEKEKRRMAQADKKKKLVNPLYSVSAFRLSVRNLHKGVTDVQLRDLCTTATQAGLKRNLASKSDLERLLAADGYPLTQRAITFPEFSGGGKKFIPFCKVMLDLVRVRGGLPQSRGYGFVEFKHHVHALACLRELNQNKKYSSSAVHVHSENGKETEKLRSTLIVEFSLENTQKVKILEERKKRQAGQRESPSDADTTHEKAKKRPRMESKSDAIIDEKGEEG